MSVQVDPKEIKALCKLTEKAKDVAPLDNKKYVWSGIHRLLAADGGLTLFTNDGQTWLTWNLPLLESTPDNYDILIPAQYFNAQIARLLDGPPCTFTEASGMLSMVQETRKIPFQEVTPKAYVAPNRPATLTEEVKSWIVPTRVLASSLKFVIPFMDANSGQPNMAVMTWHPEGILVGGTIRCRGCVRGLPDLKSFLSFKAKPAKAIIAFLTNLGDEVLITDEGNIVHFECPVHHHRLTVPGDAARFDLPRERSGSETEILKIDGPRFFGAVDAIKDTLPKDQNQLEISIEDREGSSSVLSISNGQNGIYQAGDEVQIMRDYSETPGSSVHLLVNSSVLKSALQEMTGSIFEGKYYGHKDKILYIEDERSSQADVFRIAMVTVHDLSVSPLLTEKPQAETVPVHQGG